MRIHQCPCLTWSVDNFYSISSEKSHRFAVLDLEVTLILEQKCFRISSTDCFTMRIDAECFYNRPFRDFAVSTFIKDKFGRVHFLQNAFIQRSSFKERRGPIIWDVKRNDLSSILDSLPPDVVEIGIIFGPESNSVVEYKRESQQTSKERNTEHKMIQTAFKGTNSACFESLSLDYSNLLNNEAETDITIKCGGTTFAAHRIILSARSEVFAAMFRNDMSEKCSGCIEITDTEPAVFKMFLQYIYSGTIPDLTDHIAPLLYSVAHKYAVVVLQSRCADFLMETLSENNACKLVLLADGHDDGNFKRYVIEFIINNEKILSEDEWFKLCDENMKLSNEVYKEYIKYTTSQKKV